jgi:hypothetical protein
LLSEYFLIPQEREREREREGGVEAVIGRKEGRGRRRRANRASYFVGK